MRRRLECTRLQSESRLGLMRATRETASRCVGRRAGVRLDAHESRGYRNGAARRGARDLRDWNLWNYTNVAERSQVVHISVIYAYIDTSIWKF